MPAEDYISPPLLGHEPPDRRLRSWAFRVVMLLLLLGLAIGTFFGARALIADGQGNAQAAPRAVVATAR